MLALLPRDQRYPLWGVVAQGADYLQCVIDLGGWCVVEGVSYRLIATPKRDSF